jgi:hypothetical protein
MNVFRRFVKYLPGTKPLKRASANLHLNFPFENIDNRMRIMPVDRVDGSRGVIDSNDFNLFTRCFRKQFRKERSHLLGMRCRGKSEGKDKYREDELSRITPIAVRSFEQTTAERRSGKAAKADIAFLPAAMV